MTAAPGSLNEVLADPAVSLRTYGTIVDQRTNATERYDPYKISSGLQPTIISYASDPPRMANGRTSWLVLLGSRQSGKSTTAALAPYPAVAYTPNTDAALIADQRDRADYLFHRVMINHDAWLPEIRTPQVSTNETRSLSLVNGSAYRVLSAQSGSVGIGQSTEWFVGSELAFWRDAMDQMSKIMPAMMNRYNSRMILECTPALLSEASGEYWMNLCMAAAQGGGRFVYAFFPFWDSLLCRMDWDSEYKGSPLTLEEQRLMDRYGPAGLTIENLAFRRLVMATDAGIMRNPDLFGVYYPFDDISCWISTGSGVIPQHAIDRHMSRTLHPETSDYSEFQPPREGAIYVVACDPAGHGRDHSAFQILEVWADEWIQVASFGANVPPEVFEEIVIAKAFRYNTALVVVERNGVGVGLLAALRIKRYPRIYHDEAMKPGIWKGQGQHEEWLAFLIDGLMHRLTLNGQMTLRQIRGYRSDKVTEKTLKSSLMSDDLGGRRGRGHWDKVSAMMIACAVAPRMPKRYREVAKPDNVLMFKDMTWNQHEVFAKRVDSIRNPAPTHRRAHYRRRR